MSKKKSLYVKIATLAALLSFCAGVYAVYVDLEKGVGIAFVCWLIGIGAFIFMHIDTDDDE